MLGETVAKLRKEHGWTQNDLAEASGVSQSAISAIENGVKRHLRMSTVHALAQALGVQVGELWQESVGDKIQPDRQVGGTGEDKETGMTTDDDALAWLARQNKTLAELMRSVRELPPDQRARVLEHIDRQLDLLLTLTRSGNHDQHGRDSDG